MSYERSLQAVLGGRLSVPPAEVFPTAEENRLDAECSWHCWAGYVAAFPDFWAPHVRGWLELVDLELCEAPCWVEEWDSLLAGGEEPGVAIVELVPLIQRAYPLRGPTAGYWRRQLVLGVVGRI